MIELKKLTKHGLNDGVLGISLRPEKRGALPSLGSVFGPGHDPGNFAMWHPMQRLSSEERKQQEEAAKVAGTKEILQKGSLKEEIQQGS